MKSAYEIAMERLEAESGPTKKLTDEEKGKIAAVDRKYDAKGAELKLDFDARTASAQLDERPALQEELASQLASVEEKREKEKQAIWSD